VVLADATIARYLAEGRIEIDPYDKALLQPSSVDVRVDRFFRVFHNSRYPYIDVKVAQEELTELVEVDEDHPFVLHPGEFVLGSTLERVRLPDDLVARLEGKALALDTEVPTSQGWRTMADLEPGDLVFDEDGFPTVVLAVTPPMLRRPCWRVTFSDGASVVADADHLWRTTTTNGERVLTTDDIARSLAELDHRVRLADAVWYPERDLPTDPYVLGQRLRHGGGAGTPDKLEVSGHGASSHGTRPLVYRVGGTGHEYNSPSSRLLHLILPGKKTIPTRYLTASIQQRRALLEGLLDTHRHVDSFSRCELMTASEVLAFQYMELVASLGFRPELARTGTRFTVRFTPDRSSFRSIVSVEEVPSVPVRCIEVSSPNGLFLVTRSFIPTHNSSLGRLGLLIHSTAGFIDPGWDGHVTLELSNVANLPITIYPGMKIGQVSFMQMTEPATTPYGASEIGSKYKGQTGPTPSRYWKNFEQQ
jgi:deoxycytidine triphosphate deaminase